MKCCDFPRLATERIVLRSQTQFTDGYGGQSVLWETVGTYWAWIRPLNSYEQYQQMQLQGKTTHKLVIRYNTLFKNVQDFTAYSMTFNGRTFAIHGVKNLDSTLKNYGIDYHEIMIEDNGPEIQDTQINLIVNGNLTSDATFTRASTATYFDSAGIMQTAAINAARINYLQDGSGLYGLQIEGARTNLLLASETFDNNTYWNAGTNATMSSNDDTAPDGNTTADRFTADTSITTQRREQTITVTASTAKSLTIFIKAGTQNTGQAQLIASGSSVHTLSITPTNEWTRYELSIPSSDTATSLICGIYPSDATGALGDNILVWGAQLEQASFASSYIPTTTATVTRAADICTIDLTKVGWFNDSEGAIYADIARETLDTTYSTIFSLDDGTLNNRITMALSGGAGKTTRTEINVAGVAQVAMSNVGTAADFPIKMATAYKINDIASIANDSVSTNTDSSASIPTVTTLSMGLRLSSSAHLFGVIENMTYYPLRLPDATLVTLIT